MRLRKTGRSSWTACAGTLKRSLVRMWPPGSWRWVNSHLPLRTALERPGRCSCPLPERADKTLLIAKPRGLRDLLDGLGCAQQQILRLLAAYLILEALQGRAFFLKLPV